MNDQPTLEQKLNDERPLLRFSDDLDLLHLDQIAVAVREEQLVPVEINYEAAQREYERHVDAAVFDMVLSRTGGKAIVDAALGIGSDYGR